MDAPTNLSVIHKANWAYMLYSFDVDLIVF